MAKSERELLQEDSETRIIETGSDRFIQTDEDENMFDDDDLEEGGDDDDDLELVEA